MLNLNIFRTNEVVQVLDETTYIWESAKVLGQISDWSIKVKWVEWTSKPAVAIEVPEPLRTMGVEAWNVRKFQRTERSDSTERRPRRNVTLTGNNRAFSGNPAKLARHVKVSIKHNQVFIISIQHLSK
jgi:hypothetical protein